MYLLGLFDSLGALFLAGASKNQIDYITELSQQYSEFGEKILNIFLNRNASTYVTMVAAKRLGFPRNVYYDLVGWNGLSLVPDTYKNRIALLHLAEMVDFYSVGMVDFYQVEKLSLKLFNIADEKQFAKIVNDLREGYKAEHGEY